MHSRTICAPGWSVRPFVRRGEMEVERSGLITDQTRSGIVTSLSFKSDRQPFFHLNAEWIRAVADIVLFIAAIVDLRDIPTYLGT